MYIRLKTETYQPVAYETVGFDCSGGDASIPDHGHKTFTYSTDGFVKFYEEILTDNDSERRVEWKRCDHYKRFTGPPSPLTATIVRTNRWTGESYYGPNSHLHCGVATLPYAGYKTILAGGVVKPYGDEGALNSGLPSWYSEQTDGGFIPDPSGLGGMVDTALKSMLPIIKAELSLVNSVYELKDFKRPVAALVSRLRSKELWSKLGRIGRNTLKSTPKEVIRETLRSASSNFLQWKFNIAPLISDIMGIYRALSKVEKSINDLITRSGRVQRRHYAFQWQEYVNSGEELLGDMHWLGGYTSSYLPYLPIYALSREVQYSPTQFHAEIEYNYNYSRYQVEHAQLLALLDYFGVNLNPAIIWNAIPWSFVIDWVFGVSRWLDQFKLQNMEPTINIRKFCYSVKRQRQIIVWIYPHDDLHPSLPPGTKRRLPVVTEQTYKRSVGLPAISSITSSGVNASEFTLGAALVLSRRRHRKPSRR